MSDDDEDAIEVENDIKETGDDQKRIDAVISVACVNVHSHCARI